MPSIESIQQVLDPLFPGLIGVRIVGLASERVIAGCVALHRGRTTMVWQTTIKSAEGKLCAVVTQTQLVMDA
jgi:acyl-coenzyme A thioesterase PaaI-like protein